MQITNSTNSHQQETPKMQNNLTLKAFLYTISLILLAYLAVTAATYLDNKYVAKLSNDGSQSYIEVALEQIPHLKAALNDPNIQQKIAEDMLVTSKQIDLIINREVDKIFDAIIADNVEPYLDFHYSIKGEYLELALLTSEKVGINNQGLINAIKDQLFGAKGNAELSELSNKAANLVSQAIERHLQNIVQISSEGIDTELNSEAIRHLKEKIRSDIERNLIHIKGGAIAGSVGVNAAAIVSAKLGVKIITKVGAKVSVKAATKGAAAVAGFGSGALAGAFCGPAAPVCSITLGVGAATAAWFATDAVIISLDEHINRDEFRNDIIYSLNQTRRQLKADLSSLQDNLTTVAENFKADISEVKFKRRKIHNIIHPVEE